MTSPAPASLIIPFAGALSDAGRQALHDLPLPHLERLLGRLTATHRDPADEFTWSPPHERALAQRLGLAGADGLLPLAAHAARRLQLPGAAERPAWGWLTPVHYHVGAEQVTLPDPAELLLDEAASRALFEAVSPLFTEEGFVLHWAGPLQWLAAHASLATLATASLDRVIGRGIDPWLPKIAQGPEARLWRRLQNEAQMLWHTHPVNAAREAGGMAPVNTLWLSGTGRLPDGSSPANPMPQVDDRLRGPALREDWVAWREAWAALDAGPLATMAQQATDPATPQALVLCGERAAQTFEPRPRSFTQRLAAVWQRPSAAALLETL